MRMNRDQDLSAYDVVNTYDYHDLVRIFLSMAKTNFQNKLPVRLSKQGKWSRLKQRLNWQRLSSQPNQLRHWRKRTSCQTNFPSHSYRSKRRTRRGGWIHSTSDWFVGCWRSDICDYLPFARGPLDQTIVQRSLNGGSSQRIAFLFLRICSPLWLW